MELGPGISRHSTCYRRTGLLDDNHDDDVSRLLRATESHVNIHRWFVCGVWIMVVVMMKRRRRRRSTVNEMPRSVSNSMCVRVSVRACFNLYRSLEVVRSTGKHPALTGVKDTTRSATTLFRKHGKAWVGAVSESVCMCTHHNGWYAQVDSLIGMLGCDIL